VTHQTDQVARAFQAFIPDSERVARIVPVADVTWEPVGGATNLTIWVDLGSGQVKAAAGQAVLERVQSMIAAGSPITTRLAVVLMVSGSPIVVDLLGSIVQ
jgi:hypothetical protein